LHLSQAELAKLKKLKSIKIQLIDKLVTNDLDGNNTCSINEFKKAAESLGIKLD